jgi:hypothetical protein
VAQMVEYLPTKHKALNIITITAKKKTHLKLKIKVSQKSFEKISAEQLVS